MSAFSLQKTANIEAWKAHHRSSCVESLQRILRAPLQSLLTALALAIALMLPAALLVALNNIAQLGERWDASPRLSVYLKPQMDMTAVNALQEKLKHRSGIKGITYISAEEALNKMQNLGDLAEIIQGLDRNPLPPTLIITPLLEGEHLTGLEALATELRQEPIVDQVELDLLWVKRLEQWLRLGRQFALGLGGLFTLGALIVVGNTVRLSIENRRDEILVTQLVGGTQGYIRRPFLYTGAWYGLLGGLLASFTLAIGFALLRLTTEELAATYQTDFILQGLGFLGSLGLIATSSLIGLVGAWLAVGRHLRALAPQ
ncbi:MAG TPA: permease-like cell division protein FtsX [Cellvibrionaceae bacterium]|nr:permease-like cell division protein FtsX [Cellvibrionaceae bacterium]HMW73119.1 permease-like cell division protein FtsX [Cellvibrionaceae bacterium]